MKHQALIRFTFFYELKNFLQLNSDGILVFKYKTLPRWISKPSKSKGIGKLNINMYFPLLTIGLAAMIGDFVVPLIFGKKHPNHNALYDVISELGTKESPVRKQISAWLITLGVLFICFGIGQALQFRNKTWAHLIYVWGIVVFGIGAGVIAGIFPEDTKGAEETISGKIHGTFSWLGFMFLIMNSLWAL